MIQNYMKIAWKVMLRNKVFTCISLFGISFTIMILTIVLGLIDLLIGANPPEVRKNRTLFVDYITLSKDGDTRYAFSPSRHFLNTYVRSLQTPENVSIYSDYGVSTIIHNNLRAFMAKYTDAPYWDIMQFDFIAGKAFNYADVKTGKQVAVITEAMSKEYFGNTQAVGKSFRGGSREGDIHVQIVGIVKNPPFGVNAFADIWMPYTIDKRQENATVMTGNYKAMLLASSRSDFGQINREYRQVLNKINFPDPEKYNIIESNALNSFERLAEGDHLRLRIYLVVFFSLAFLFILLPSINLINMNTSRMMERASEIGVRKSFGAASATLVWQFMVENMLITIIGGIIGFVLAIFAADLLVRLFNYLDPVFKLTEGQFQVNWRVMAYSFLASFLFGIISGWYPAWKMSRLHPVEALKGGEL